MTKILSVSIAAYNVSTTLKEVLKPFLIDNILKRVDVMIIDDGSTDNTAKIALEYQKNFPNTFRLISKKNGGWGSTINTGIKNAKGKYFKQLDGDDYFSYENLDSFLDYLETCDTDIVHTPFVTYSDSTGGILNVLNDFRWQEYNDYPKRKSFLISEFPYFCPEMHNLTIKTKLLQEEQVNITEHCFYTDVEYSLKAFSISNTISFYEKPIYFYRLAFQGQSMGLIGVRKHYQDNQKMLYGMLEYYTHEALEKAKRRVLFDRLLSVCELMYRMYFALKCSKKQKKELMEFDFFLKTNYPEFYKKITSRPVLILRKSHFWGYWLIGHYKMFRDRRFKINFFEGE